MSATKIEIPENFDFLSFSNFDKSLKSAYFAYKPSDSILELVSENNRTLFGEKFQIEEDKRRVPSLYCLSLKTLAQNFKGKANIDQNFDDLTKTKFWNFVDVDLPILNCLSINNELYWKRVYNIKTKNKLVISKERTADDQTDWKCIGLSIKYAEILERSKYETWVDDEMEKLTQLVSSFVFSLKITQLNSVQEYSIDKDPNLLEFKIRNYYPEECHHINLNIIGELVNLVKLKFEFSPPKLGRNYHSRFFNFSSLDVANLGSGISKLTGLKSLIICQSRWDANKLGILVNSLNEIPIEVIEFSFCQLKDDCGHILANLLEQNSSIKSLNLTGNYINQLGMSSLSYGIQNFGGTLEYLDISRNPIHDNGIILLGKALHNAPQQINNLNVSALEITETGCRTLAEIIKFHTTFTQIEMIALPIGETVGIQLVKSLEANKNIMKMDCRDCELSEEQEFQLRVLLDRNNYIRENPYIDNMNMANTEPEFANKWVSKMKNSILLKTLKDLEEHKICKKNFKPELDFSSCVVPYPNYQRSSLSIPKSSKYSKMKISISNKTSCPAWRDDTAFSFEPNSFTEEEFLKHVQ